MPDGLFIATLMRLKFRDKLLECKSSETNFVRAHCANLIAESYDLKRGESHYTPIITLRYGKVKISYQKNYSPVGRVLEFASTESTHFME